MQKKLWVNKLICKTCVYHKIKENTLLITVTEQPLPWRATRRRCRKQGEGGGGGQEGRLGGGGGGGGGFDGGGSTIASTCLFSLPLRCGMRRNDAGGETGRKV
ncbi:hypothetical protein PUN28_010641 [Cardiocondyla obscurior]|uniref:Uncharacterized protein n=1 Tax=Cardiocondyla obscurior TaxID=286306 RepID=A0AAW2FKG2_9HYME